MITGSFNWSPSAAHQNDETLLVFDSPQLAEHFSAEINRLWKGAELGLTPRLQRKIERQRLSCGSGVQRGITQTNTTQGDTTQVHTTSG